VSIPVAVSSTRSLASDGVLEVVGRFAHWLETYGETSQDHQDFFASPIGRFAKQLYYRSPILGTLAVSPMIFCEAFAPWARRFFFPRQRFPIADAHFAMGFALLYRVTGEAGYLSKAVHFLEVLKQTRCPGYERYGWGYPFDWQTQGGVLAAGTPLITTTPYCYEAFDYVYRLDAAPEWREIMRSVAEHALLDYKDFETNPGAATCTYTPSGGERVVNASAYRSFLLFSAWSEFGDDRYREVAERNLNFVLQCQAENGSWPYAVDGKRGFIDHFHTCFVMKSLAKIQRITGHERCSRALNRGVRYYVQHLFDEAGLPKPFSKAPRLTLYRRELYDIAECLNLGVLLLGRFPALDAVVQKTLHHALEKWVLPCGQFRARKLFVGWDNTPMHRWGQSQMFRSLCLILAKEKGVDPAIPFRERL